MTPRLKPTSKAAAKNTRERRVARKAPKNNPANKQGLAPPTEINKN
jgi:hypothetical protein